MAQVAAKNVPTIHRVELDSAYVDVYLPARTQLEFFSIESACAQMAKNPLPTYSEYCASKGMKISVDIRSSFTLHRLNEIAEDIREGAITRVLTASILRG